MKTTGHIFKFMTQSIAARYSMFGGLDAGEVGSHHRRRYRYEAAGAPASTTTSPSKLSAIKAVICKPIEITED